ncbi:MAG: porin family protein, partial [Proteobacteria bacterium]|nr:porin family protein [Pseudomonadota bacterium]
MENNQCHRAKLVAGLVCAMGIALPFGVQAAENGPYIEGRIGLSLPLTSDLDSAGASQEMGLDNGLVGNIAVGHQYGNGFRTELEAGYRKNDVDTISGGGGGGGDVKTWSAMINALYDFNVEGKWQPFVGVGAGIARVDISSATPSAGTGLNDADTAFAWQGMAGVAYAVNHNVKLTLGYRYFSAPDVEVSSSAGTGFDSEYASHDVLFGVRFSFGNPKKMPVMEEAAPPAPPPVAAA